MTASTDTEIRELIIQLNQNLESKLDKLDQKLENELGKLDQKLEIKLDKLDQKLENELGKLDQKLEIKLDKLDQKLENELGKLDQKLESKLDKIVTRLDAVEVGQARAEEKLNGVEKGLDGINQEITRLRDVTEKQDNRYYTLLISTIGFLISAFIAVLIGLGKVLFFPSPSIS